MASSRSDQIYLVGFKRLRDVSLLPRAQRSDYSVIC